MHSYQVGGGWAVSLIWAMMILPLADALQNCLQNLTSRIAGVDNEQMTGRVMGIGAMLGFSLGTMKEQFKTPNSNSGISENSNGGLKGFVSKAKSIISPGMNLSSEKDYSGNINPIRDVIPKQKEDNKSITIPKSNENDSLKIKNGNKLNIAKSIAGTTAKVGAKATKSYLEVGAKMAEGNFVKNPYKSNHKSNSQKKNFQNTEYMNKVANDNNEVKKLGEGNESERKS